MLALIMLEESRLIYAAGKEYATPTFFSNTHKFFKQIRGYV